MEKQTLNSRQDAILEELRQHGYVSIKEIAALFGVSEMTVRRDFKSLPEDIPIKNINGTLVYDTGAGKGQYKLDDEQIKHNMEKNAIGRFAAAMVQKDDIIIVDTGTTTVHVAASFPPDIQVTALCYNSNILWQLQRLPHVQIMLAGGDYHANTQMFESDQGIRYIRETRAHKVFVSAAGIHADLGLTCVERYEVATKKAILQSAEKRILVADYTKFGVIQSSYFCDLQEIDVIVTNAALSPEWIKIIREKDIELHLV